MKMVTLGDVATIDRKVVEPSALPPDTAYLGLEHMERGGRILRYGTVASDNITSSKFQFAPIHVLFGKLRPYLGKISRPDRSGICSTDILPIRPGRQLDRGYLAHYLSQPYMVAYASAQATGANLPRLSPGSLAEFPLPLPQIEEQRRVAAILDQADALRAKRRRVVVHLDALLQSVFRDMFGDPDEQIKTVPFAEVATLSGGRNLVASDQTMDSKYRVIKISAVTSGRFRPDESKPLPADYVPPAEHLIQTGDLLMSRANTTELVGSVALVSDSHPNLALPDKSGSSPGMTRGAMHSSITPYFEILLSVADWVVSRAVPVDQ